MTTWIFWGLLLMGMTLMGVGLGTEALRFRRWQVVRAQHDGEIVLGSAILEVGQRTNVSAEQNRGKTAREIAGRIVALEKRALTVALEPDETGLATGKAAFFSLGTTVTVVVVTQEGQYRFTAPARDERPDSQNPGAHLLTLPRPTWLAHIQRRQHFRAPIKMPATFERVDSSLSVLPNHSDRASLPLHGTVLNLSGGGLCAEIERRAGENGEPLPTPDFEPGIVLRVRLPLPALSCPLLVRVRSCVQGTLSGGPGARLACAFLPLDAWEQETLIKFVFQVQKERLQGRFGSPKPLSFG